MLRSPTSLDGPELKGDVSMVLVPLFNTPLDSFPFSLFGIKFKDRIISRCGGGLEMISGDLLAITSSIHDVK